MAQPKQFDKAEKGASEKLAKGKTPPEKAAEMRHHRDQVLGKTDSNYHNK